MFDRHFRLPDLPPWLTIYGVDTTAMVEEDTPSTLAAQETQFKSTLCDRPGWRMIFGHHPPVSNGEHGDGVPLAKILEAWSDHCAFQLYFAGHDHHQEYLSTSLFDIVLQGAGGAAVRDVKVQDSLRVWGSRGWHR